MCSRIFRYVFQNRLDNRTQFSPLDVLFPSAISLFSQSHNHWSLPISFCFAILSFFLDFEFFGQFLCLFVAIVFPQFHFTPPLCGVLCLSVCFTRSHNHRSLPISVLLFTLKISVLDNHCSLPI